MMAEFAYEDGVEVRPGDRVVSFDDCGLWLCPQFDEDFELVRRGSCAS